MPLTEPHGSRPLHEPAAPGRWPEGFGWLIAMTLVGVLYLVVLLDLYDVLDWL
jgi:hypothetical protein